MAYLFDSGMQIFCSSSVRWRYQPESPVQLFRRLWKNVEGFSRLFGRLPAALCDFSTGMAVKTVAPATQETDRKLVLVMGALKAPSFALYSWSITKCKVNVATEPQQRECRSSCSTGKYFLGQCEDHSGVTQAGQARASGWSCE